MKNYKLSARSENNLIGIHKDLEKVVREAIKITDIDFAVVCGLRTKQEQEVLLKKGVTQTMKSKHLIGEAVDLMAYVDGRASWELPAYYPIADAMRIAAVELGVRLRWGAAWHINNMARESGDTQELAMAYIDLRRAQKRTPFIDAPHFEIMLG